MGSGLKWVFPDNSVVKNPSTSAEDAGSIPESEDPLVHGNPRQYSCLGNPMNRGAWQTAVHGAAKESDTTQSLNNNNNILLQ